MFSDDVYRNRLSGVIETLEAWAAGQRDVADVETQATASFWKLSVAPHVTGACPVALMVRADQRFNVQIADETYEDKPVDSFEFFPMLLRAIAAGNVERVVISSALTAAIDAIEMRVTLEDGWAWIGERRMGRPARRDAGKGATDSAQEMRAYRFLPYRR